MSVYSAGRSEKLFDDPLDYKPERWLKTNRRNINHFASLPFGFGQRMCIGKRLSRPFTSFFLLTLLRSVIHDAVESVIVFLLFIRTGRRIAEMKMYLFLAKVRSADGNVG